jgi:hypothetical protein
MKNCHDINKIALRHFWTFVKVLTDRQLKVILKLFVNNLITGIDWFDNITSLLDCLSLNDKCLLLFLLSNLNIHSADVVESWLYFSIINNFSRSLSNFRNKSCNRKIVWTCHSDRIYITLICNYWLSIPRNVFLNVCC